MNEDLKQWLDKRESKAGSPKTRRMVRRLRALVEAEELRQPKPPAPSVTGLYEPPYSPGYLPEPAAPTPRQPRAFPPPDIEFSEEEVEDRAKFLHDMASREGRLSYGWDPPWDGMNDAQKVGFREEARRQLRLEHRAQDLYEESQLAKSGSPAWTELPAEERATWVAEARNGRR